MENIGSITLKKGKDKTIRLGHPWIFSKGIERFDGHSGSICSVLSIEGEHLGFGYVNTKTNIRLRMLGHMEKELNDLVFRLIQKSIERRAEFDLESNARRVVNGENDGLSGLIIDQYEDVVVVQFSTLGMQNLKHQVVEAIKILLRPKAIYEKSTSISRKEEGLNSFCGWLYGEGHSGIVEIYEKDVKFVVDVVQGQKTGFFLDQRQMRYWIRQFVKNKTVLNLCAYTGGFSLHALKAGAKSVTSVDLSKDACLQMHEHTILNGLNNHHVAQKDVFDFLNTNAELFDFVIVDPPAFIKSRKDLQKGSKAYRDLNRLALRSVKKGGILLSSSCSYYMDTSLFEVILMESALSEKRDTKVFQKHIQAYDHLINIAFREGEYLKSIVQVCL